jgi:transmembrane sensor
MTSRRAAAAVDEIAGRAVAWIVQLSADDAVERARAVAGFEAWKSADPRHAEVAAGMQGIIDQALRLRGETGDGVMPAHAALNAAQAAERKQRGARRMAAALATAAALVLPGWLVLHGYPPGYLMADARTATGQWKTQTLADGTRLTMSGASAVNLHFGEQRRVLELVRGEILVEVAHDAKRPFLVETGDGSVRALGTRFVVRNDGAGTTLTMLESRTLVRTATRSATISAGQRVRIHADALGPIESVDGRGIDDAWKFHQLVAQGSSLPEVLDELNRHRPGHIRFDRSRLDGIKVYVVLPLDDTERALQLLVDSLPALRVRKFTDYFVMVDAAAPMQK